KRIEELIECFADASCFFVRIYASSLAAHRQCAAQNFGTLFLGKVLHVIGEEGNAIKFCKKNVDWKTDRQQSTDFLQTCAELLSRSNRSLRRPMLEEVLAGVTQDDRPGCSLLPFSRTGCRSLRPSSRMSRDQRAGSVRSSPPQSTKTAWLVYQTFAERVGKILLS